MLAGLAFGAWFGARWFAAEPGSAEDVYARIRIGMGQEQVVEVLRTYHDSSIDGLSAQGTTKDGLSWRINPIKGLLFEDLPPPQQVAQGVLKVWDNDGREVEVVLGPGGKVAGKGLMPGVLAFRMDKVRRALTSARLDLLTRSWWSEQLRKADRSLRHKSLYIALCLAAAFVLASVWILRCRGSLGRKSQVQIEASTQSKNKGWHALR
jgi:hypothetical protein